MTKRVDLFPGQGAQKKGMGGELFQRYPELVAQADALLGYSVAELCLTDPRGELNRTLFTQPALYVVSTLMWLDGLTQSPSLPDYVAGHSLGEYGALFAAGVFDFTTGLAIVQKRAQLMDEARGGAMAAIIGLAPEAIRAALEQAGLGSIDIANLNAPEQTVISGPEADLPKAREVLESAGASMVVPLAVSAAFHSRYMADAQRAFAAFLREIPLERPTIPVLSNVTARPHESGQIASLLARQIVEPVRWTESVRWLLEEAGSDVEFCEVGPGNVLTGLIRRIRR